MAKRGKRAANAPPTWHEPSKAWRKRITVKGEQKDYRYKYPHTKTGAKAAASAWAADYCAIRADAEAEGDEKARKEMISLLLAAAGYSDGELAPQLRRMLADAQGGMTAANAMHREQQRFEARQFLASVEPSADAEAAEITTQLASEDAQTSGSQTMGELLDDYLASVDRRKFNNEISTRRAGSIRYNIAYIRKFIGQTPVPSDERELGRLLHDFRSEQEDKVHQSVIKPGTFDDKLKDWQQFVQWAVNNYRLPTMPRNAKLAFRKMGGAPTSEHRKTRALDKATIKILWNTADDRVRLYIALALNCGMYAIDISSLTPDHFKDGKLYFTRQKTKKKTGGVRVVYKLWSVTDKLAKKYINKSGPVAFTDEQGRPLFHVYDSGARADRIATAFRELRDKLKIDHISFENLRDTGATLVESIDRRWTDVYLAHADKRMATAYLDSVDDSAYDGLHGVTDEMYEQLKDSITEIDTP